MRLQEPQTFYAKAGARHKILAKNSPAKEAIWGATQRPVDDERVGHHFENSLN
jgi:hypothetical protein